MTAIFSSFFFFLFFCTTLNIVSASSDSDFTPPLERPKSVSLGQLQSAWTKAPTLSGVYTIAHQKDQIIRIQTRPYMLTTIVLPPWEEIEESMLGDNHCFGCEKKNNHILFLWAKEEACDTSLTIIGKKSVIYSFYVRSEGVLSPHLPDLVVYVTRPDKREEETPIAEKSTKGEDDYMEEVPFDPHTLTFFFEMISKNQHAFCLRFLEYRSLHLLFD